MVRSGDFLRVPFFLRKNGHESIDSLYTLREFALVGRRLLRLLAQAEKVLVDLLRGPGAVVVVRRCGVGRCRGGSRPRTLGWRRGGDAVLSGDTRGRCCGR